MGRHGYTDDSDDVLDLGRWRAQVSSAIRGKRGQRFLRDVIRALDALPEKRLIKNDLVNEEGAVTSAMKGTSSACSRKPTDKGESRCAPIS
jgi:hypothetical protein